MYHSLQKRTQSVIPLTASKTNTNKQATASFRVPPQTIDNSQPQPEVKEYSPELANLLSKKVANTTIDPEFQGDAIQRMLHSSTPTKSSIQAKSIVEYTGDKYQQKSDSIGSTVMSMPVLNRVVQREYDLEDNSEVNKKRMRDYDQVLREIHEILTKEKIQYKLQGSMAQAMHKGGVLQLPGDLDILVPSPIFAADHLVNSKLFKLDVRAGIVSKVLHNETGVKVDLAQTEDFGMTAAATEEIDGITVLNLYETLLGLLLRPEKRPKDHIAFVSLIVPRGNELTDEQQGKLAKKAGTNWQHLYEIACDEYKRIVLSK